MPNECWFLNPQLWKLHFLRYQKQHRCSVTDGKLDHPSLSLWDAQRSLRGICVRHWQRWDSGCLVARALHTQPDSRQLSQRLSGSTRRSPASPVLLDILCVGSTGVSHITGEGCYLIKVYDCRPGISEVAFKFLLLEFSMASTASRCSVQMFR